MCHCPSISVATQVVLPTVGILNSPATTTCPIPCFCVDWNSATAGAAESTNAVTMPTKTPRALIFSMILLLLLSIGFGDLVLDDPAMILADRLIRVNHRRPTRTTLATQGTWIDSNCWRAMPIGKGIVRNNPCL